MLPTLHLIFLFAYPFFPSATPEPHHKYLSPQSLKSISAPTYLSHKNWPTMQNNWIILQAAPTQSQRYPYDSFNHSGSHKLQKYVPLHNSASKELKVAEPYVLAISKVPEPSDAFGTTQREYATHRSSDKYHRPMLDVLREKTEKLSTIPEIAKKTLNVSEGAPMVTNAYANDDAVDAPSAAESSAEDEAVQSLSDILVPLENAIDKVRNFCDVVKKIISDTDGDEESTQSTTSSSLSNDGEIQGRDNTQSSKTGTSSIVGTGRKSKKIKKRFKKFLLPLLLAYKLKFLTLIPVLIGGLTLLVGSTGLAGFFFALFTAVMSLRSSAGAKTVVVKKI